MASGSSGSATGNPRNKVALKPGHSLMDWIRLGNSGKDLTGVGGVPTTVTRAQLAKHNTQDDAWLSIRGIVYNVTHYMDFHPGGCEELMRGVGTDATSLFNQVHAWVNYQSILQKCIVGQLGSSSPEENVFSLPSSPDYKSPPARVGEVSVMFVKDGRKCTCPLSDVKDYKSLKVGDVRKVRWMDHCYYDATINKMRGGEVSVTFLKDSIKYTCPLSDVQDYISLKVGDVRQVRWKDQFYDAVIENIRINSVNNYHGQMKWSQQSASITFEFSSNATTPQVQIFQSEPDCVICKINSDVRILKLKGIVEWPGNISIDPRRHHIQLKLNKLKEGLWEDYGNVVDNNSSSSLDYWQTEIISVDRETHDTCLIKMKYVKNVYNYVGVAQHIFVKHNFDGEEVIRPYTSFPMLPITAPPPGNWCTTSETINLMVKAYSLGIMGSWLCSLETGNTLLISNPFGSFSTDVFSNISQVYLFAAGTGITPMISIIVWLLQTSRDKIIKLKYFNKTVNDIMWKAKFDELMTENSRFSVEHIISDMNSAWTGKKGHVTLDLLEEFLPEHSKDTPRTDYLCICGPKPFTSVIEKWLMEDLGYTAKNYFTFVGYK